MNHTNECATSHNNAHRYRLGSYWPDYDVMCSWGFETFETKEAAQADADGFNKSSPYEQSTVVVITADGAWPDGRRPRWEFGVELERLAALGATGQEAEDDHSKKVAQHTLFVWQALVLEIRDEEVRKGHNEEFAIGWAMCSLDVILRDSMDEATRVKIIDRLNLETFGDRS